ncbi:hypothetical protein L1987_10982 [Smallanthus sonchifolius]|uniref:Uncharacterized protein n=1 Tax=Smallanthus sonchifolius TaxID=185202 RepID=A0ACB9J9P8_9ASTR|nr:hypothetical protein L1987_10982 [Smallanthus sonchifolius]
MRFLAEVRAQIPLSGSSGGVSDKSERAKMNHCGIQQSSNFSSFGNGAPVVCPKPRRLNLFNTGPELLDLMLQHGGGGGYGAPEDTCTQFASSPPFFCGSPPTRVSNPLIQDARFGDEKISPISPRSMIPNPSSGMPGSSPSSSARKGGYLRTRNKPSVRIEGFNCLDRGNRRNCSIPALA